MKRKFLFLLTLIILLGSILSIYISYAFWKIDNRGIIREFENEIEGKALEILKEVNGHKEGLYTLSALFLNDNDVDSKIFSEVAKRVIIRHDDIQALEWIPKVLANEKEAYINERRNEFPDYTFTERDREGRMVEAEEREIYYPVYYIEPYYGNESAFGYDLASSQVRLESLEESLETGRLLASGAINLVQSEDGAKGLLMFLPVYSGRPISVDQKRVGLRGFILAVFNINEMVEEAVGVEAMQHIDLKVYDVSNGHEDEVYTHTTKDELSEYSYRVTIGDIGGRKWELSGIPSSEYLKLRQSETSILIFLASSSFFVIIITYVVMNYRRSLVIEKQVQERTIELNEANKKLEAMSNLDGLTNIYNRRYFDNRFEQVWDKALASNSSITILMIDVDSFKGYNDYYGHIRGDEVLRNVSARINTLLLKKEGIFARYGGEEFIALVVNELEVGELAETIRKEVEKLRIENVKSAACQYITVSIGVYGEKANYDRNYQDLILYADKALYRAKGSGRNRVEVYKEE